MDLSAALAADLKALTDALEEPGIDLETLLRAVFVDTRAAVPSYLGLTMRLVIDGQPLTFTTMSPGPAATSLFLPLPTVDGIEPGGVIVFYAATPGAFVDLAADLSFALGLELDAIALDQHLTATRDPSELLSPNLDGGDRMEGTVGIDGLAAMSTRNQALGILIDRGHTEEDAQTELQCLARHHQSTINAAAQQLIHTTTQRTTAESG